MMYCLNNIFCLSQILVLYLERVFTCVNFSHTSLSLEQIMTKFSKRMSSICFALLFFFLSLFPLLPFCALGISELIEGHLVNPRKGNSK